jgi:uncharacterized LabA/DUF88 family protein
MGNNYLFVDGSCLLADIGRIKRSFKELNNKMLSVEKFYRHFIGRKYSQYIGEGYKRFTIYFVKNEDRVKDLLIMPNFKSPNQIEDLHIKYCGKKVSRSTNVEAWIEKTNPPPYIMERFNKSEKAVDTQICCDALQLAAVNRLDRLFLYTNDYDFMPLIDVLKTLGVNITLIKLNSLPVNKELVENCDSFCVPDKQELLTLFS